MFIYNPKDWWKLIFYFHRADTFRRLLPAMIAVAIYTTIFYFIENKVLHLQSIKNPVAIHSLVGFVLSLLLVFRNNTSYERWWEGRKLWGNFTNNCRNIAVKIAAFIPENEVDKNIFRLLLGNYVVATKDRLREHPNLKHLEFAAPYNVEYYNDFQHLPNRIAMALFQKVNELYKNKAISGDQMLILNNDLTSLTDSMGACERIRNTPIPATYNIFIKKIIFMYVFTMPIMFVLEFQLWAIPIVTLVFYAFAGIELIAEEIEDPFGTDKNDLQLDTICKNIKSNLKEIL